MLEAQHGGRQRNTGADVPQTSLISPGARVHTIYVICWYHSLPNNSPHFFFFFFCINMFSEKPGSADTGGFRMWDIMCGDTQDWEFCRRSTNAECYCCSLQGMNLTTEQTAVKGWEVKCNTRIWGVKICVPAHLDFCLTLQFILVFILALALLLCSVISWVSACINVSVGVFFFLCSKKF